MSAIRANWINGQIVPLEPVDWPEGSELLIEPIAPKPQRIGLDESEWRDDAEARADWEAWIGTLEPLEYMEEECVSLERYREEFRRVNLEAVRKQMGLGDEA